METPVDSPSKTKKKIKERKAYKIIPVLFWVFLWQIIAMVIDKEMLLASPFNVLITLGSLLRRRVFWTSILNSFVKIVFGFLLGLSFAVSLAILSYKSRICKELVEPLMKVIKSTPVASFIIIALIWIKSGNLSILISFLMVVPIIYSNTLQGLYEIDPKILEMALVFDVGWAKRVRYIYIPGLMPYFVSAVSVALGFCWKSGIAAEVIGLPKNSIGEHLYEAKLYLMTKELFAWTIVIIIISVIFEKLVMILLKSDSI